MKTLKNIDVLFVVGFGPLVRDGLTKRFMSMEDIVNLVPEPMQEKRGSYKKKAIAE